jgi:hypothetical protein
MADKFKNKSDTVEAPDPFDLDSLRVNPERGGLGSIRQILTHIPVRKPGKQQFIQALPGAELPVELLILKDEGENYLIAPDLRETVATEVTLVTLQLAITPQRVVSIWPVVIPGDPPNPWHLSAIEAANYARDGWIKVVADMNLGAYRIMKALGDLPAPEWPKELGETPEIMMQSAIRIAFRGKMIDDPDHPVLKRLRGEMV